MNLQFYFVARCSKGRDVGRHAHDALELVYYLEGAGKSTIDGKTYDLRRNSFTVTPKGVFHDQENRANLVSICMGLSRSNLEPLQGGWFDPGGVLGRVLRTLGLELNLKRPGHDLICRGLLLEIAGLIQRIARENDNLPRKKALVDKALEIIQRHEGTVSVSDLAGQLYVSKDYLRHLFREYTSHSPIQHIIQARIEKARDLLGRHDLGIKEVASQCGFDSVYYFSRLFRKVTGGAPSRCRGPDRFTLELTGPK